MTLSRFRPLLVGLAAAFLASCQQDEIRTYQVPKPEMTRLLGAILSHDDSTWFFKVSGPAANVNSHKAEFAAFLHSLQFSGPADQPLTWKLPQGWRLDKGNRPGRYATILVGDKDALELTIVKLGREGQASSVIANVNRWRNQLALAPVTEDDLRNDTKELKAEAGVITVVDLTGTGSGKTGATAPFAGGDRMPPAAVKEEKKDLDYRLPEGWRKSRGSAISKVAFEVREGEQSAQVTVTPLSGAAGGLEQNVNRWREQAGLERLSDTEVRKLVQEIPAGGKSGQYVDVTGPKQRILGVIVPQAGASWFVKMTGPVDLVGKQKPNFEAFAGSLRFPAE
jgi:hypothetical protein